MAGPGGVSSLTHYKHGNVSSGEGESSSPVDAG